MRLYFGCIDKGETPRDCIIRECYEELGIEGAAFKYLGLMKFLMMPDYFSSKERIEYGGLYGVTLENMTIEEIYHQINDRVAAAASGCANRHRSRQNGAERDRKGYERDGGRRD